MPILDPMWSHKTFRAQLADPLRLDPDALGELADATRAEIDIAREDAPAEETQPRETSGDRNLTTTG